MDSRELAAEEPRHGPIGDALGAPLRHGGPGAAVAAYRLELRLQVRQVQRWTEADLRS